MKWIYADEWFLWLPAGDRPPTPDQLIAHPSFYAQIPDALYQRLEDANKAMQAVMQEIDANWPGRDDDTLSQAVSTAN